MTSNKREDLLKPSTIEFLYHWLLKIFAIASGLFAVGKIFFFASIFSELNTHAISTYKYYLVATIIGAGFNIGAWGVFRNRSFSHNHAFIILFCNSILCSAYWLFAFNIHKNFFSPLVIPIFLILCGAAGLVCSLKGSVIMATVCAMEVGLLFLWARSQNMVFDFTVHEFLPAVFGLFFILNLPVNYVSRKMQEGEQHVRKTASELDTLNKQMETAQEILSRYVAPQFAQKIFKGEVDDVSGHQRRKLTLFFSDIKDFTATADAMEAEDLADLLNCYLDEMVTIATDFGGTVAQISGDGIFVFFGAPEFSNDKDQAERCVQMAITMQTRMKNLKSHWFASGIEHPFRIRCGINTGSVTVGGFGSKGRREYTAIGMQVNIAARLEAACDPGQILMSHTTWSLIKDEIPCIENGPIQVKGFHRPILTYQVNLTSVNTQS